ncbi:hypothetical protein ATCC90586_008907 [Pythium insidiosum]|nr:hypothetical protein ATCC90586_008907 [Pythium insidiosum]
MSIVIKGAVFAAGLALYTWPRELVEAVLSDTAMGDMPAHVIRFALTMLSYMWALTRSATWYYAIMVIVVLQTMCWASFVVDERVLAHFGYDTFSKDDEKAIFQTGAIALYGCMLLLLLFGDSETSEEQYRVHGSKRLVAFYTKHNPEKLPDVDRILAKYQNNEELLFTRLHRKYSVLSHTRAEDAVDEVGADEAIPHDGQGDVEEVELLQPEAHREAADSEEDEGFHLVQQQRTASSVATSTTSTVKAIGRAMATNDLDAASRTPSPPTQSPSSAAGGAKSEAIRAAIDEARRAQEARVQQRIAQLAARSASKTA